MTIIHLLQRNGEKMILVCDPSSQDRFLDGWSDSAEGPEGNLHRWSVANHATLRVPTVNRNPGERFTAKLEVIPYLVPGVVDYQDVLLFIDGLFACTFRFRAAGQQVANYDVTFMKMGIANYSTLAFQLPDAVSPSTLGVSADLRKLAIGFHSIELT